MAEGEIAPPQEATNATTNSSGAGENKPVDPIKTPFSEPPKDPIVQRFNTVMDETREAEETRRKLKDYLITGDPEEKLRAAKAASEAFTVGNTSEASSQVKSNSQESLPSQPVSEHDKQLLRDDLRSFIAGSAKTAIENGDEQARVALESLTPEKQEQLIEGFSKSADGLSALRTLMAIWSSSSYSGQGHH